MAKKSTKVLLSSFLAGMMIKPEDWKKIDLEFPDCPSHFTGYGKELKVKPQEVLRWMQKKGLKFNRSLAADLYHFPVWKVEN